MENRLALQVSLGKRDLPNLLVLLVSGATGRLVRPCMKSMAFAIKDLSLPLHEPRFYPAEFAVPAEGELRRPDNRTNPEGC